MTDKQLKDKAVSIQGKQYVLVSDRVLYFNSMHKNGCIETKLLSPYDSDLVVVQAMVTPDADHPQRMFTGYSQERVGEGFINKTSALENAETSAVGRALAMMGIGVIESIASVDEINKAQNQTKRTVFATPKQIDWIRGEARKVTGLEHNDDIDEWLAKPEVLSMPPHKVPIFKVKDAVDKIKSLHDNNHQELAMPPMSDEEFDQAIEQIKSGEIPT